MRLMVIGLALSASLGCWPAVGVLAVVAVPTVTAVGLSIEANRSDKCLGADGKWEPCAEEETSK